MMIKLSQAKRYQLQSWGHPRWIKWNRRTDICKSFEDMLIMIKYTKLSKKSFSMGFQTKSHPYLITLKRSGVSKRALLLRMTSLCMAAVYLSLQAFVPPCWAASTMHTKASHAPKLELASQSTGQVWIGISRSLSKAAMTVKTADHLTPKNHW